MKLTSENNLAAKFPEIAKEWSKKNSLTPDKVTPRSGKKVWWECFNCGHEWKASPNQRTCGRNNCLVCRSLAVKFPEIAKEWSKKNRLTAYEILPGSNKPGLWECSKCGHEWKASPHQRVYDNHSCLVCRSLAVKFPEIAKEWSKKNSLTAYEIVPGSKKKYFWECSKCGYSWKASPQQRIYDNHSCLVCRSLAVNFPDIAKEWSEKNILTPDKVTAGSNKKYFWECSKCGYSWKARPARRTSSNKTGCPACDNKVVTSTNNLAVKFPEIAKEWSKKNRLTAYEIVPGSNKKGLWECAKCCHEWEARPNDRTSDGNGCPECSKGKFERACGEDLELAFKNLKSADFIIQGQVKINEKRRYYDFGVKKDDFIAGLLEADGEDHYKPVRRSKNQTDETLNKNLKDCQKRDKEKTKYAKEQGIPLLRVSYKERKEQNKQIKQGIPKTETPLYKKYERFACDCINFYYSSK
jgi:hypothetical protein